MPNRAPTIQDVARLAGVSTATVSRTLSSPVRVSAATRARVEDAVTAIGYRTNVAARNLRRRRAGAILMLVPNLSNPFFSRIIAAATEAAGAVGLTLMVADSAAERRRSGRALDAVLARPADGVLLLDGAVAGTEIGACRAPVVTVCEWVEGAAVPAVMVDNPGGVALAVRHLAALGHRRLGQITGPAGNVLAEVRARAFEEACAATGVLTSEDWRFAGDFSLACGADAARAWLALDARPSAVFGANDESAFGFIAALHDAGVAVPRDVSVVGFDDIDVAERFIPALTTIHQPRGVGGRLAAELLIAAIDGDAPGAEDVVLAVDLVERASVATVG